MLGVAFDGLREGLRIRGALIGASLGVRAFGGGGTGIFLGTPSIFVRTFLALTGLLVTELSVVFVDGSVVLDICELQSPLCDHLIAEFCRSSTSSSKELEKPGLGRSPLSLLRLTVALPSRPDALQNSRNGEEVYPRPRQDFHLETGDGQEPQNSQRQLQCADERGTTAL